MPNLRSLKAKKVVTEAFEAAREHLQVRLVRYSIQPDQIHAIVEASDSRALSRAMKGLCVRIARHLNLVFGRKGAVFADRFEARVLRSLREAHDALRLVPEDGPLHGIEPRSFLLRRAWGLPSPHRTSAAPQDPLRICEPTGHVSFDALPLGRVHELAKRRRGRSACGSRTVLA